jgi:hypothetical protein
LAIASQQKDNSTFSRKAELRVKALLELERPVVLETHGGFGKLFSRCYSHVPDGVVFETKPEKCAVLARQRPSWAVYEADCVRALGAGVGHHLPVNFVDLDPYGEPWPVLDAFFAGLRRGPGRLVLVVNDGLRQKLKMNGGWNVASKRTVVDRLGNGAMYSNYLAICRDLVKAKGGAAGYELKNWTGYYCGFADQMTHYAAVLEVRQ